MEFPSTNKCLTNGCNELVIRENSSDIPFCLECRRNYGKFMKNSRETEYFRRRSNQRIRGRDLIAERLKDGFSLLHKSDKGE